MRKLLLFFISLSSFLSFGQLSEGFEGGAAIPAGWAVFDNSIGTGVSWGTTTLSGFGWVHEGTRSAMVNRENVTDGTIAEDWLVTPLVTVPASGQVRFFARSGSNGEQGSVYKVKISIASQTNPADFTTLATYTELDIVNGPFQQKFVLLDAYAGQNVYIAFVMENDDGDRWIIDNINVDAQCLVQTSQTVSAISDTSVSLGWNNPSGATEWEIEWGPQGFTQGTGTLVPGIMTNPYTLNGLTAGTTYDFYVRAVCGQDNPSPWFGFRRFTTALCAVADQCDFVFRMTDDWGDGWNGATMQVRQFGVVIRTIGGTFTNGAGPVNVIVPLCSNQPFDLFWNNGGGFSNEVGVEIIDPLSVSIFNMPFNSGALVNTVVYSGNAACTPPTCPQPTNILLSGVNSTSGTVTWTDNAGASEWEVIIQPAGTGYPTGSGIQVFAPTYNFSGLLPGVNYEVYVRAICSVSDQSFWSGPINFSTNPDYCAGSHFYDIGGQTGPYLNNQNSTTTICADNPGDVISVLFNTFSTESGFDFLRIYDGPNATFPLVGTYAGTALPPQYTATSASGCLTFVFTSDGSVTGTGWDATIICSPPPTCRQPTTLAVTGISSTGATLSWTDINVGVTNWQIVVQPAGTGYPTAASTIINANSNPFAVTGLNPNTSYEYYVLSDCGSTDGISFWSGPRTFNTLFPGCNGSVPAGNACPEAAPVCSLDGYCGNTSSTYTDVSWAQLDTAFCGSIENNSFLTFQATSTSITMDVNVGNCTNGSGIQFFVFTAATCGSGPVTTVNCFNSMNPGVNALSFTGLTIGQNYYLMIDGYAGAVCDYSVTITSGSSTSTDVILSPSNQTICINETVDLTVTGGNGIYNWSPATGLSAVTGSAVTFTPPAPGIYTVTVQSTDTNSLCATSDFIEITVLDLVTPTFDVINPFCENTTAPVLATTSNNGITGTWSPAIVDNMNSGIYTFTPNGGLCANVVNVSIAVTAETVPSFISPAPICSGDTAPVLSNTSNDGITGTWSPSTVNNTASATYTFTPDAGQCATVVTLNVQVLSTCSFGTIASAVLIDDCNTSASGEFLNTTSGSQTIGALTNVFPNSNLGTFVQSSGNLMFNGAELRTFKTATSNVCSARLNYRIYPTATTPGSFTIINLPLLEDCTTGTYPTGGSPCATGDQRWQNIAASIDLTTNVPGNYIIEVYYDVTGDNDNPSQCDDSLVLDNGGLYYSATFSIQSTPAFVFTNPTTCNGTEGSITVSGFNPGDTYSVTYTDDTVTVGPANFIADVTGNVIISGLNAGVYSGFDFSINGCNIVDNISITLVDPIYTPTFVQVGPFCVGDVIVLPTTSIEGFTGTWTPTVDNTQTTIYTFTPTAGQCATVFSSYTVVVSSTPSVTSVTSNTPICFGEDAIFTVNGTAGATLYYAINSGVTQSVSVPASGIAIITISAVTANTTLTLSSINIGSCSTPLTSSSTVVVNALPVVSSLTAVNSTICSSDNASFTIQGTANATVTYTVNSGSNQTVVLNTSGQSGAITINNPTADVVIQLVDIVLGACNSSVSNTITITVISVPTPTIGITSQPTCAIQTANFEVLSPLNSQLNTAGDLFISEVTDAVTGALTYVEIYNGTGATIDLSNYKLKVFNNGNATPSTGCDNVLSGSLLNNDVVVIKLSTSPNIGGVPVDLTYASCGAVNNNDLIALSTIADVIFDVWGINGTIFTPGVGYTYRRLTTATLPSATWNSADWSLLDPEDYSDVGTYTLYTSNYEYILSNGTTTTTQTNTTFTGTVPGTYTLVAHDLITGCFSSPYTFTIAPFVYANAVTSFTYSTPVCISESVNPLPDTSISGFVSGGTFSANSSNVVIDAITGEIDLSGSIGGVYTISYNVVQDNTSCVNAGSSTFEITITSSSVPTFNDIEVCVRSQETLPSVSLEGYSGTWSPSTMDASVEGTTVYYFTPNSSCGEVGVLTVIVKNCFIQKGISPNGDGLNDYFDLSSFNVNKLGIFNRHGKKVYSKVSYSKEWNGKSDNGNDLPDGTYYYVIDFNDMESRTGWIYINRER